MFVFVRLTEVSASENRTARATCHVVESVGAPVSTDDGGQDVIKGVNVFEGNQSIPEQPPRLVRHHLQHAVCHVGLSCKEKKTGKDKHKSGNNTAGRP